MKALTSLLVLFVVACDGEHVESARPAASPTAVRQERREGTPTTTSASAPPSHAKESCGELAMTRAALIEKGQGEKHPELVSVEALLAQCTEKTPSTEECRRVSNELIEATSRGYGTNHPTVRSLRAKQALCPK